MKLGFVEKDLAIQNTIKEITILDYYQPENAHHASVKYAVEALKLPPSFNMEEIDARSSMGSFYDNSRNSSASRDDPFSTSN
jgi:hypothetical protein